MPSKGKLMKTNSLSIALVMQK